MIFTCIYALSGISCLGIALGILGANLVDAQAEVVSAAEQASKKELLKTFNPTIGNDGAVDAQQNVLSKSKDVQKAETITAGFLPNFVVRFGPLLLLQVLLAWWIGYESGWDLSKTVYYVIMTGTCLTPLLCNYGFTKNCAICANQVFYCRLYCWIWRRSAKVSNGQAGVYLFYSLGGGIHGSMAQYGR
jgi:hypothetical protein